MCGDEHSFEASCEVEDANPVISPRSAIQVTGEILTLKNRNSVSDVNQCDFRPFLDQDLIQMLVFSLKFSGHQIELVNYFEAGQQNVPSS